jgi:hypothetical protein
MQGTNIKRLHWTLEQRPCLEDVESHQENVRTEEAVVLHSGYSWQHCMYRMVEQRKHPARMDAAANAWSTAVPPWW